jgi:hypothetical protein
MLSSYLVMSIWAVAFQPLLTVAEVNAVQLYQSEPSRGDVSYVNMVYFVNWYGNPPNFLRWKCWQAAGVCGQIGPTGTRD